MIGSTGPLKKLGDAAIRRYQKHVSANLADDRDHHCPYTPSCSHYGQDAVKEYGLVEGSAMAFMRMMRCHGRAKGGYDPVIPKKDRNKPRKFHPAHLDYKYESAEKIFSYPSYLHPVSKGGVEMAKPKGIMGKIKHGLKSCVVGTTSALGGAAGAALFAAIGTPLGAYLGHKAGRNEIDDVNAKIAKTYSPESVYGFAKIENSLAKASYKINRFVKNKTGSETAAKVAGSIVGGPVGLAMGFAKSALKGAQIGSQYGRLFGINVTKANAPKEKAQIPTAKLEDVCTYFKDKTVFDVGNTQIAPVQDKEVVPSMTSFIQSAKESIDIDIFSIKSPEMANQLCKKAKQGVKIRVVTNLGGKLKIHQDRNKKVLKKMKDAGIDVRLYPVTRAVNQFNHSKMVIVDKKAALLGTRNWGYSYGKDDDKDTVFYFSGGTVKEARGIFEKDWGKCGGKPETVNPDDNNPSVNLFRSAPLSPKIYTELKHSIMDAQKTMDISAYWLSDKGVIKEVAKAKQRGVKVRVFMSNYPENKFADKYFIDHGVDFRVYDQKETKTEGNDYHRKIAVIDGKKVIMGSCDWTPQGFHLNNEVNMTAKDEKLASHMTKLFEEDWKNRSCETPKFKDKDKQLKGFKERLRKLSEKLPATLQKTGMILTSLFAVAKAKQGKV